MGSACSRYGNEPHRTHRCAETPARSCEYGAPSDRYSACPDAVTVGRRRSTALALPSHRLRKASHRDLVELIPPSDKTQSSPFPHSIWEAHSHRGVLPARFAYCSNDLANLKLATNRERQARSDLNLRNSDDFELNRR